MNNAGAVVIADSNRRSRAEMAAALQRTGHSIIEVKTGAETLELTRSVDVELLVLEVTLPDMTGFEVCRQLRSDGYEVPIFFVSATRTDPHDRVAGLLLGADDYLAKPLDPNELVARAHRHISRRCGSSRLPAPSAPTITRREEEVLSFLAGGARPKVIAHELSISAKTVGTHIQNLFGKLGVHSRAELVARAYLLGLVAPDVADVTIAARATVRARER